MRSSIIDLGLRIGVFDVVIGRSICTTVFHCLSQIVELMLRPYKIVLMDFRSAISSL